MKAVTVYMSCDVCGIQEEHEDELNVTVNTVSLNGMIYEIDMCPQCKMDEARRLATIGRAPSNPQVRKRTTAGRKQAAKVRAWWLEQHATMDTDLSAYQERGRIPDDVLTAYEGR